MPPEDHDNESNNEDDDNSQSGKPTGKQMREKLEQALSENAALKGQLLIHDSGLGHLTERQRRAVIREAQDEGKDLTADLLKSVAKDLGYEQPKQPTQQGEGDNSGEGDPNPVNESLDNLDAIDRTTRQGAPSMDPNSFEQKIANAKTAEEVEAIIRTDGAKVGLIHEHDVE